MYIRVKDNELLPVGIGTRSATCFDQWYQEYPKAVTIAA